MKKPSEIISTLYELGYTDQSIADEVGSTQPTIWRVRNGEVDCKASLYIELTAMLARVTESAKTA